MPLLFVAVSTSSLRNMEAGVGKRGQRHQGKLENCQQYGTCTMTGKCPCIVYYPLWGVMSHITGFDPQDEIVFLWSSLYHHSRVSITR